MNTQVNIFKKKNKEKKTATKRINFSAMDKQHISFVHLLLKQNGISLHFNRWDTKISSKQTTNEFGFL